MRWAWGSAVNCAAIADTMFYEILVLVGDLVGKQEDDITYGLSECDEFAVLWIFAQPDAGYSGWRLVVSILR